MVFSPVTFTGILRLVFPYFSGSLIVGKTALTINLSWIEEAPSLQGTNRRETLFDDDDSDSEKLPDTTPEHHGHGHRSE